MREAAEGEAPVLLAAADVDVAGPSAPTSDPSPSTPLVIVATFFSLISSKNTLPYFSLRCCDDPRHFILPRTMMPMRVQSASASSIECVVRIAARLPPARNAPNGDGAAADDEVAAGSAEAAVFTDAAAAAGSPRNASVMHCQRNLLETGSSPELGSSSSVSLESAISEMAKQTLRFVPPEMAVMALSA